mgnify:CR=1 FL=1
MTQEATCHTHPKPRDERKVEHNVQNGRNKQEVQRRLAVAQRPQESRRDVIPELEHQSRRVNAEIQKRQRQQRLRRAKRTFQQKSRAHNADQRHEKPHCQHQHNRCCSIPPQFLFARSAEVLRDQNARSDGKADGKRREQDRQRRACPDSGKRLLAVEIADDNGVGSIIKLLQQISCHDGQRKL